MAVSILMKQIRDEFLFAQSFVENEGDDHHLIALFLSKINSPYLSVSFEAVSFSLAKLDIVDKATAFERWRTYAESCQKHSTQIHIGLGWALTFQKLPISSVDSFILPFMLCKVADGVGYADGFFKQRATIHLRKEPIGVPLHLFPGYYQGLGRAMWYVSEGDISKLTHFISSFDDNIIPHLWRGVGIASTYVGGLYESDFKSLKEVLRTNLNDYKVGVALAIQSRGKANMANDFTLEACKFWLKKDLKEIVEQMNKKELKYLNSKVENSYADFLLEIGKYLK